MRKNNVADMTITEQLEAMGEMFCIDYCKYPNAFHERLLRDEYNNEDQANEAMQREICDHCPLMRL